MNTHSRHPLFDRTRVKMKPLVQRINRNYISQQVSATAKPNLLPTDIQESIIEIASRIEQAQRDHKAIILAFGAHTIKNGLGSLLIRYLEQHYVTHLATNGAGVIHDWELAYLGETSEHVQENLSRGEFGNWQETGFYINLALVAGAYAGLGYGDSIGRLIMQDKIDIPTQEALQDAIIDTYKSNPRQAAAAADFLDVINRFNLQPGAVQVNHIYKQVSIQAAAYRLGIPFTAHPMFGHDIIYNHPASLGAAVGRCAERDFLSYAHSVSQLDGGIYLSVGSAVMSPMIFEKSMSMAQNAALQTGSLLSKHHIVVVDLQKSSWDWSQGEPPENHPDYYLRFNKTFSRAGGKMRYLQCDNRDFLQTLYQTLEQMRL